MCQAVMLGGTRCPNEREDREVPSRSPSPAYRVQHYQLNAQLLSYARLFRLSLPPPLQARINTDFKGPKPYALAAVGVDGSTPGRPRGLADLVVCGRIKQFPHSASSRDRESQ